MFQNQPSAQRPTGRASTILLVEDDPDILNIPRRLMQGLNSGYDIVTVSDGAQALAQSAQRPVRLLITDYSMPKMTGIDLTKAVKEISPATHVLLITAYATPELEKWASEAGVDYYLSKPFPLTRLMQIARDTLL